MTREGIVHTIPIVGVSLGHRHEKTAISISERAYMLASPGERFNEGHHGVQEAREEVRVQYWVPHLERHGPPSRYAKVAKRLPQIAYKLIPEAGFFILVVDVTTMGPPVYAPITQETYLGLWGSGIRYRHCPITVANVAGGTFKGPDVGWLVPRHDLIRASQILFDEGQRKIAEGLDLAEALRDELLAFKPKAAGPEDLDAWRIGKDDDPVLAVATSVWAAERFLRKEDSVPIGSCVAA